MVEFRSMNAASLALRHHGSYFHGQIISVAPLSHTARRSSGSSQSYSNNAAAAGPSPSPSPSPSPYPNAATAAVDSSRLSHNNHPSAQPHTSFSVNSNSNAAPAPPGPSPTQRQFVRMHNLVNGVTDHQIARFFMYCGAILNVNVFREARYVMMRFIY